MKLIVSRSRWCSVCEPEILCTSVVSRTTATTAPPLPVRSSLYPRWPSSRGRLDSSSITVAPFLIGCRGPRCAPAASHRINDSCAEKVVPIMDASFCVRYNKETNLLSPQTAYSRFERHTWVDASVRINALLSRNFSTNVSGRFNTSADDTHIEISVKLPWPLYSLCWVRCGDSPAATVADRSSSLSVRLPPRYGKKWPACRLGNSVLPLRSG